MFNQILTAFQGFFSRSFWFGSFLPVAIVAAMHIVIAGIALPAQVPLQEWLEATVSDKAASSTVVLAGLVVLAYVLVPVTPLVRGVLDGRLLPDWLHDRLQARRLKERLKASADAKAARLLFAEFRRFRQEEIRKIWDAQDKGNALPNCTDQPAIATAETEVGKVQTEMLSGLPKLATVKGAFDALVHALELNPSKRSDDAASKKLADARSLFIELITEAHKDAEYRSKRMASYDRMDRPSRSGDARRLAERYSEDTYRVEFDYVWTRIQMLLPKEDDGFRQRLIDTESQVNFSVLALALAFTVPLFWLPFLLFTASSPWLFLAIGLLSPLVLRFFYELVVQSQTVFGQVVRVAIDKYRLQVLTEIMRQPLPATLTAERTLWTRLQQASEPGNQFDLTFAHRKEP